MIRLPPKRPRERSGILREPPRIFPRHERFVRSHSCCITGCENRPIQLAHVRSAANSGTGIKPASWWSISLCAAHHAQQHQVGQAAFERMYRVDLFELAKAFAAATPDAAMKDAMREAGES